MRTERQILVVDSALEMARDSAHSTLSEIVASVEGIAARLREARGAK